MNVLQSLVILKKHLFDCFELFLHLCLLTSSLDFRKGHIFFETLLEVICSVILKFPKNGPVFHKHSFLLFTCFRKMNCFNVFESSLNYESIQENICVFEPHDIIFGRKENTSSFCDEVEKVVSRRYHTRI